RRSMRNCIGLSIASVADRKRRLNCSARSDSSLVFSSSSESAFKSLVVSTSDLLAVDEAGPYRQLGGGERHGLARQLLRHAFDLEQHPARLDHGDPALRI